MLGSGAEVELEGELELKVPIILMISSTYVQNRC
jgi:hypothetical protein